MAITNFITHQIHINESGGLTARLRESEIAADETIETLTAELKQAYLSRINREHGRFSEESEASGLALWLDELEQGQQSFLQFSEQLMKQLVQLLEEQGSEIRGHLILFIEQQHEQRGSICSSSISELPRGLTKRRK